MSIEATPPPEDRAVTLPIPDERLLTIGEEGACRGQDPAIFYPERGDELGDARWFCEHCPVTSICLDWALGHERHGIWGNTSERQRRRLRKALGITLTDPTLEAAPEDLAS